MRRRISIPLFSVLFLFLSTSVFAQKVRSDYEVQKSFKQQYHRYQNEIDMISSQDSAMALIDSIKTFDENYREYSDLLNKALYPDTYDQKMDELRQSSVQTLNRLRTITRQTEQLDKLETELTSYQQSLQELNQHADSLEQAMIKSVQSEKHLSDMVRNYRKSLEKRDDLILAFIDSMVVAYQKMDLTEIQDLENIENKSRLETDGNALKMIHEITQENLQILNKNSENLRLQDYMRMSEVQYQFQNMWKRLGNKIKEVYNGDDAEKLASDIDNNITEWNKLLKSQTFAVLNDTLSEEGITLGEFNSSESLNSSLNAYLDQKIKQSKKDHSESAYQDFKRFQGFWNKVEIQWSSNFVDAGLITQSQMATINEKVDMWAENAAPPKSNDILVYLLGASVLLAIALGVLLIREKKSKSKG
ncbi:MAG: hypothetical protein PVH63_05885 [Balneolaceae bacterium]|jgi:hypothetical protein